MTVLSYSNRFSKLRYPELLGTSPSVPPPGLCPRPPADFHTFSLLQTQFGTENPCYLKCFKNHLRPMSYSLQNKYVTKLLGREKQHIVLTLNAKEQKERKI